MTFSRSCETPEGRFFSYLPPPARMSFLLTLYVFLPSFFLSVFLVLRAGGPKEAYWLSCASILTFMSFMVFIKKQMRLSDAVAFLILIVLAHAASWYIFDFSHDSLAYFGAAIRRIAAGFNPVYDGLMDFGRPPDNWNGNATYFPKAMMYFAASVTDATGDIQFGKAYQLILLAAALFFVWDFAAGETPVKKCLWLAMCLNPITITHLTFMTVDGALASLSMISAAYAAASFEGRRLHRASHVTAVMALTLLFCVKTTGFPFGTIIIFCIVLNRFVSVWRGGKGKTEASRLKNAARSSFLTGLRLGGITLLLVSVMGFHPYITNMLQGRNIFYPAVQSGETQQEAALSEGLEAAAGVIYPSANNRFTRLLYSTFSHTQAEIIPSRQKSPLSAPYADWEMFATTANVRAGAMGPLFSLVLIIALVGACFLGKVTESQAWLLFMLLLLIFIHPHAWQTRYAPSYWCLPFLLLLSIPVKKEYFILIPLSLALANNGGIFYHYAKMQFKLSSDIKQIMAAHEGETVMLDKSIFEFDSFFDRYSIKQKFVNPEETNFSRLPGFALLAVNPTDVTVNLFFKSDLSPLPNFPMVISEDEAEPWMLMSEGIAPLRIVPVNAGSTDESKLPERRWLSYKNKIKFFMKADMPQSDWLLTLKGKSYSLTMPPEKTVSVWVFANNQTLGHWAAEEAGNDITLRIPRRLLEESFADPTQLFTLMLRMPKAVTQGGSSLKMGLELEEIYLRPDTALP